MAKIVAVPEPLVSVVVSTYNRPARLAQLLQALRDQTLPAEAFEVIVVDNGSEPPTGALLTCEGSRDGLTLVRARHEQTLGPGAGRNTGWRLARRRWSRSPTTTAALSRAGSRRPWRSRASTRGH